MTVAFSVSGLRKNYGATEALGGVDIEIHRGELFGLLGPNGAGKSTLVKIGCGLVRPGAGSVEVCGEHPGSAQARRSLGYLAELFRFPGWLTGDEILELHQRLSESSGGPAERAELLELTGLSNVGRRRVENMSKGMQQRLGIAQALVGRPTVLLLDEPTSALDPAGRRAVRGLLEELRNRNIAVLLNSHLLTEVELVCDRVAILDSGRIVAEGSPAILTETLGVEIETDDGVRSFPSAGREEVPQIVAELVEQGVRIYGVRPARRTLEDIYLDVVGDRPG
jgi:ABC-2 type transport system ATP-binding protein